MKPGVRFHIRDGGDETGLWIGPGKVALLEAIELTGSITVSARKLGMSYRRAWLLIDATNRCLVRPAVKATAGGRRGGGTSLTKTGSELVRRYRALEHETERAVAHQLARLLRTVESASRRGKRFE